MPAAGPKGQARFRQAVEFGREIGAPGDGRAPDESTEDSKWITRTLVWILRLDIKRWS